MRRYAAGIFAATLLAATALMAAPTISASASSSVTTTWVTSYGSDTFTYACTGNSTHTYYGENISHVTNGCSTRVWLHANTDGSGATYCINPGATAYGFTRTYEQFLISTNGAACDAGQEVPAEWAGIWTNYDCVDGSTHVLQYFGSYEFLDEIDNFCNVRVWAHQNPNGSGATLCISPGTTVTNINLNYSTEFDQFLISSNQAPCSAG